MPHLAWHGPTVPNRAVSLIRPVGTAFLGTGGLAWHGQAQGGPVGTAWPPAAHRSRSRAHGRSKEPEAGPTSLHGLRACLTALATRSPMRRSTSRSDSERSLQGVSQLGLGLGCSRAHLTHSSRTRRPRASRSRAWTPSGRGGKGQEKQTNEPSGSWPRATCPQAQRGILEQSSAWRRGWPASSHLHSGHTLMGARLHRGGPHQRRKPAQPVRASGLGEWSTGAAWGQSSAYARAFTARRTSVRASSVKRARAASPAGGVRTTTGSGV